MQSTMQWCSKQFRNGILAITLLIAFGLSLRSQVQDQAPGPARSRTDETLALWNAIGNKLVAMAEDFPEDKYDFKVQKDERTFALNLLHAAALDFVLIRRISGSNLGPDFGEGDNPTRDQFKTKSDIVKFLKEAVADGAKVIQDQGDAGLDKTTKFFGNRLAHNSYIWAFVIEHSAEHYGQLVVYYRANNLIPPDSRRQAQTAQPASAAQAVDLKGPDGTILKASYFAAAKPGPGVLLFHQSNRTRQSWDDLARQLAAAGINTLTIDTRGYGESGGKKQDREQYEDSDLDVAFDYLVSQPGVTRESIGVGGAGWLGVDSSVETARRHIAAVKSMVLISGETLLPQLRFMRQASQLPGLFVVSDDDEYPPTVEVMEWLYDCSSSPQKQFIHYIGPKAPWLWYETSDPSKVPATGSHGTDLFQRHPELPAAIVDWFVTTLIRTPGRAPADAMASAAILDEIETAGGVAEATRKLLEARKRDPKAQLWPEVNVDIIGEDHTRLAEVEKKAGQLHEAEIERKAGIEIFKLNLLAYPDSADAHSNLADAYLANGQKDLAREYAEKALAMIDSHKAPLSSWSDTGPRRAEVRNDVEDVLKNVNAVH
ncbi:MAG TPA: DinB family protein [Candidatus Acidoferrales bacterium]|nr:DinB family protein [Candidatus Acidoferrales bacterium]